MRLLFLSLIVHLAVITRAQKAPPPTGAVAAAAAGPVGAAGSVGPQACGTTSFTFSADVYSPGYPGNYYNFADCTYTLTAGAGGRVHLTFNNFVLETNYDFLDITSDGLHVGRYTGPTRPPVMTLGRSVTLHFTSDFSMVTTGFSISFLTIDANCGGLVVGSGLIQSPGYPGVYPANAQCVWGVVATQGQSVTLDFQAFKVEKGFDWVELYEGSERVARYTGLTIPPRAFLGSAGRVVLSTDSTIQLTGISIAANSAVATCGGSISGSPTISSPNYPSNYVNNAFCTWTYRTTPSAVATRLTFFALNIENNFDFLKIYEGETLRNTYTGAVLPQPIELKSGTITAIFTSDTNTVSTGFQLRFDPIF